MEGAWYPVALADGLERGKSAGTRLFGRELVIWRDGAGSSHVWEDRCPHRGMRLSFGFVRDNHLACLYHGWRYDDAAQCRYIPAHPDLAVPDTIRVGAYNSVERLGIIWAYSDPGGEAPEPLNCAERPVTPVRSLFVDAAPADTFDALGAVTGTGPEGAVSKSRSSRADPLVSLATDTDDILIAVQPLSERETAMHIVIADAPDAHRVAKQKRVSAWSEAFRRKLESLATTDVPEIRDEAAR